MLRRSGGIVNDQRAKALRIGRIEFTSAGAKRKAA